MSVPQRPTNLDRYRRSLCRVQTLDADVERQLAEAMEGR